MDVLDKQQRGRAAPEHRVRQGPSRMSASWTLVSSLSLILLSACLLPLSRLSPHTAAVFDRPESHPRTMRLVLLVVVEGAKSIRQRSWYRSSTKVGRSWLLEMVPENNHGSVPLILHSDYPRPWHLQRRHDPTPPVARRWHVATLLSRPAPGPAHNARECALESWLSVTSPDVCRS